MMARSIAEAAQALYWLAKVLPAIAVSASVLLTAFPAKSITINLTYNSTSLNLHRLRSVMAAAICRISCELLRRCGKISFAMIGP